MSSQASCVLQTSVQPVLHPIADLGDPVARTSIAVGARERARHARQAPPVQLAAVTSLRPSAIVILNLAKCEANNAFNPKTNACCRLMRILLLMLSSCLHRSLQTCTHQLVQCPHHSVPELMHSKPTLTQQLCTRSLFPCFSVLILEHPGTTDLSLSALWV